MQPERNPRAPALAPQNALSFVLFRAYGIQFELNVTFIVLVAWVMISLYRTAHDAQMAIYAAVLVTVVFACVFVHEVGHALMARAFHIRTKSITLTAAGGHAEFSRMPDRPFQELLISLSGPAVNLALGGAVFVYLKLVGNVPSPAPFTNPNANPLGQFMWLNFALGLTNLAPLFPLDGGRVVRALLGFFLPYPTATRVVSIGSRLLAVPIALMGMHGHPIYLLLAGWVWLGARAASEDARSRYALKPFTARDVMVSQFESLQIDGTLRDAAAAFVRTFQDEFPVMNGSEVVGVLSFPDLTRALDEHGADVPISRAMRSGYGAVRPDDNLEDVLKRLNDTQEKIALVREKDRILGIVPMSNLKELVKVQRALGVV